jgi:hypothetical protein
VNAAQNQPRKFKKTSVLHPSLRALVPRCNADRTQTESKNGSPPDENIRLYYQRFGRFKSSDPSV